MSSHRKIRYPVLLALLMIFYAGLLISGSASASQLVSQTWFDAATAYTNNTGPLFPLFQSQQTTLPIFGPGYNRALPRVNAALHPFLTINMVEKSQQVLPAPFGPTRLWTYEVKDSFTHQVLAPAWWPGVTVETERYIPTVVTYQNQLPSFNPANPTGPGLLQGLVSIDQTIHWADPFNPGPRFGMMGPCMDNPTGSYSDPNGNTIFCNQPWTGPVATVPHLHGAEVPSYFDGGPDAWFTPQSAQFDGINGAGYSTFNSLLGGGKGTGYTSGLLAIPAFSKWLAQQSFAQSGPGKATYLYDNNQEPGTLWFHDHQMGGTRTNVISGLQAFYFIRDPLNEPRNLPKGAYEIEMAVQDRQFDTTGQLFWPDGSSSSLVACGSGLSGDPCLNGPPPNPQIHPIWIPEFIGDVAMVNGAPWPVMQVEPRRYLFRMLDGSNARAYNLTFGDTANGEAQPSVYVIGNDDNYLNAPAKIANTFNPIFYGLGPNYTQNVFMAPGQRAYVVVDFTGMANGSTVTLLNDAPIPFPSGLSPVQFPDPVTGQILPADQPQMSKIMQFKVNLALKSADNSCNPAAGGCKRPNQVVSLANVTNNGTGKNVIKKRELILKEFEGSGQFGGPGGPVEVLVQNTKYDGTMSPGIAGDFPLDGMSELPRDGSIEEWTIINLTMDAHPMHTHLVQFQILNRQDFDTDGTMGSGIAGGYLLAWGNAFLKNGSYACANQGNPLIWPNPDPDPVMAAQNPCPGWGPPLPYNTPNVDGAIGGNPAVGPYLVNSPVKPFAWENGWRDTAVAYPGQVLKMLVRWAPTSVKQAAGANYSGMNFFTFDPTAGPGYVWHCHIVDHEDNEMMRPYRVLP